MKCSKYFGAKWRGFIKSESILAPKGASRFKTQNIRHDMGKKEFLIIGHNISLITSNVKETSTTFAIESSSRFN